jgi:GNAT superfamily N-acetyltransferase
MRAQEFVNHQLREDIENFPIANVRRANGAIGTQGVNTGQAADVLTHAAGMQVSPDMTMRELVDALKADPAAQQRLRQFVQKNPVTVYALPDGSYHLQDGNHRTFLLNLLGDETVPAVVKEGVAENFADGKNPVKFTVTTPDGYTHSFQITLAVHGKHVGHFNFVRGADTDDVNNEAEVESRWQGQGYGKLLLMKAIDVANNHGLDFQQDIRGITDAQQNVYDSLENAGLIVTPGDGFWFLTPQGEQELNGLNENFADGKNPGRKGLAKRSGVNTKASVSSLRKTAKNSSGEKQRMSHWLANMKSGREKAKRK